MKQIELYVPLASSDDTSPLRGRWAWLEDCLLQYFDGFSMYTVEGKWREDSLSPVHIDVCRVYRIAAKDRESTYRAINEIAHTVKKYWEQESVLYTVSDVDAVFI